MKATSLLATVALAATVSACSSVNTKTGDLNLPTFETNLHAGYVALGEYEAVQGDFTDATFYRSRANSISAGNVPALTNLAHRKIPTEFVKELTDARASLENFFNKGSKTKAPRSSAKAQNMFDCWAEQQEENFQSEDINSCRADFYLAMEQLSKSMRVKHKAPAIAAKPMAHLYFNVYFDFDKSEMTPDAAAVVSSAVKHLSKNDDYKVAVIGHTDTVGASDYNMNLSKSRALMVVGNLIDAGVSKDRIKLQFMGENNLPVPTADGVMNASNRMVRIIIIK